MFHRASIHIVALCSLLWVVHSTSYGQPFGGAGGEFVQAKGVISLDKAPSGGKFRAAVIAAVAEGHHVNANKPTSDYLIPTKLELEEQTGLSFGEVVYPEPEKKKYEFSKEKLAIYEGEIVIGFEVTVSEGFPLGHHVINCVLGYQACNDAGQCFMPKKVSVSIPFEVVSRDAKTNPANEEIFSGIDFGAASKAAHPGMDDEDVVQASPRSDSSEALKDVYGIDGVPTIVFIDAGGRERKDLRIVGFVAPERLLTVMSHVLEGTATGQEESNVAGLIEKLGYFPAFAIIFVWGLALNLTPCVYPIIPITVSYFGGQSEGRPRKVFVLACFYVLGMAITYSVLGVLAAMSGKMLGAWLQNPLLLIFVAAILVALSLSMFGLYEFRMPNFLVSKSAPKQGLLGAIFMGLVMGAVAAPCIGPFVLALFTFVADTRSPLLGFLMFFTLAAGLGLPYIFLGTFSGSINALPKSGVWMVWVKKIFGFVMIGMALYFLRTLPVVSGIFWILVAALCIAAGVYLGWLEGAVSESRAFRWVRRATGVVVILIGVWAILPQPEVEGIKWTAYEKTKFEEAIRSGRPVMMDFYADWCIPCKELDKFTFKNPDVVKRARSFAAFKVDLTRADF